MEARKPKTPKEFTFNFGRKEGSILSDYAVNNENL